MVSFGHNFIFFKCEFTNQNKTWEFDSRCQTAIPSQKTNTKDNLISQYSQITPALGFSNAY